MEPQMDLWQQEAAAELALILHGLCSGGFDSPQDLRDRLLDCGNLLALGEDRGEAGGVLREVLHHHAVALRSLASLLAQRSQEPKEELLIQAFQQALTAWREQPPEALVRELNQNLLLLQVASQNLLKENNHMIIVENTTRTEAVYRITLEIPADEAALHRLEALRDTVQASHMFPDDAYTACQQLEAAIRQAKTLANPA